MGNIVLCYLLGLYKTREQVEACLKRLEGLRDKIKKDMADLDAMWEGPAHDTYKAEWKDELERIDDYIKSFKELAKYEDYAYTEYSAATTKAQSIVETLK